MRILQVVKNPCSINYVITCLGYRNIVIHCGINDMRDNSAGRTESDPEPTDVKAHFELLARKVSLVKQMCPLSSKVVNPLLPTINQRLNQRVLEFNAHFSLISWQMMYVVKEYVVQTSLHLLMSNGVC